MRFVESIAGKVLPVFPYLIKDIWVVTVFLATFDSDGVGVFFVLPLTIATFSKEYFLSVVQPIIFAPRLISLQAVILSLITTAHSMKAITPIPTTPPIMPKIEAGLIWLLLLLLLPR